MKYSKATSYALHTLLYMSAFSQGKPVGVQQLADQQRVSPTYLSKILTKLVKVGLIESASGAGGGYRLKGKSGDISFLDVIQAVEGNTSLFDDCCDQGDPACAVHQVMTAAENTMEDYLSSVKIVALAEQMKNIHAKRHAKEEIRQ